MATVYVLRLWSDIGVYVGCTRGDTSKRLREHRCLLRKKRHTCKALQDAYDSDPDPFLSIWSVRSCPDDLISRREAETEVMKQFGARLFNAGYNSFRPTDEAIRKGVEASRHVEGKKRSPEANLKRSLAQKGKPKGHGAKISATKQARKAQQVMR